MRLIDADVLKEKFLEMGCLDDKPCYGVEILDRMPIILDIERVGKLISDLIQQIEDEENKLKQIREDIEKEAKAFKNIDKQMANAFNESLKIIDKYMEKYKCY